jgi:hypothetical protein
MLDKTAQQLDAGRRLLRNAIATYAARQKALSVATSKQSQANDLLATAQKRLASYAGTDELLASHREAVARDWVLAGGGKRAGVPVDLVERVRERDQCQDDIDAAKSAIAALSTEVVAAEDEMRYARSVVSEVARDILVGEAIALGKRLTTVKNECRELQYKLRGLSGCWLPHLRADGGPGPVALPPAVLEAVDDPLERQHPGWQTPWAHFGELWRAYHAELCEDSSATFEGVVHEDKENA